METKKHEPLFHIVKRDVLPRKISWGIRALAILASLIVCGIITVAVTGLNPIKVYITIVQGAFGTARKTWVTFQNIAILFLISLACNCRLYDLSGRKASQRSDSSAYGCIQSCCRWNLGIDTGILQGKVEYQ